MSFPKCHRTIRYVYNIISITTVKITLTLFKVVLPVFFEKLPTFACSVSILLVVRMRDYDVASRTAASVGPSLCRLNMSTQHHVPGPLHAEAELAKSRSVVGGI